MTARDARAAWRELPFGMPAGVVALAFAPLVGWRSIREDTSDSGFFGVVVAVSLVLLGCSLALRSQRSLRMTRLFGGGVAAVAAALFGVMVAIAMESPPEGEASWQVWWYVAQTIVAAALATAAVWIADVRISRLEGAEQQARDDLAAARHAELLLALRSAPATASAAPRAGWLKVLLRSVVRRRSRPAVGR